MATLPFNGFKFDGPKLDDFDLPRIGARIGVGEDIIHAVMDVEAGGKSTDKNGRLKALYEPHVAYRNSSVATRGRLVQARLAYPNWKKDYPADSYPRIEKAMAVDKRAALLATSWGFPQILGENYAAAGYDSPEEMVEDFQENEDNQLEAMIRFIKAAGLDDELRVLEKKLKAGQKIMADDCRAFVRGYNGSGYEKNGYHTKFAAALNKWAKIPDTPYTTEDLRDDAEDIAASLDEQRETARQADKTVIPATYRDGEKYQVVENVQQRLDELGYPEVGTVDGRWGTKTEAAVLAFRNDNGLPTVADIDEALLAALLTAPPRKIAPERANATIADLKALGAEDVAKADNTQIGGMALGGVGAVIALSQVIESLDGYGKMLPKLAETIKPFQTFVTDNIWVVLIAGGVYIWTQTDLLKKIRLFKHQTGQDVSQ